MSSIVWTRNCSALKIFRLERRRAEIRIRAHHVRAQFGHDGLGVGDQRFVVVERDDAHLIRREPEREVARAFHCLRRCPLVNSRARSFTP